MKVCELFKQINKEDVFLSYIRRYDIIEPYDHRFEVSQEVKYYNIFKERMFNFIDKISNMESDKISEDIIYVIDINALDYEEKTKKNFELFSVNKQELNDLVDKDFTMYLPEKDLRLKRYAISFTEHDIIANCDVSNKSIEMYGKEAVVAAICHSMQTFDFGDDTEAKQKLFDSLEKSIDEMESGETKTYSMDEVEDMIENEMKSLIKDADEVTYRDEYKRFRDSTKELIGRWREKKMIENDAIMVNFIKEDNIN